jgi:hypothetical protein
MTEVIFSIFFFVFEDIFFELIILKKKEYSDADIIYNFNAVAIFVVHTSGTCSGTESEGLAC